MFGYTNDCYAKLIKESLVIESADHNKNTGSIAIDSIVVQLKSDDNYVSYIQISGSGIDTLLKYDDVLPLYVAEHDFNLLLKEYHTYLAIDKFFISDMKQKNRLFQYHEVIMHHSTGFQTDDTVIMY